MPEKTKCKKADEESATEITCAKEETAELGGEADWSKDQKENSYYYDDAYGYEIYNPDEDDDSENC